MAVNKVVRSTGEVLIDLTSDTVTPEVLLSGYTAHNAAGVPVTGTASGGSVNYRTQAQWDAMTFEQRKAVGLTLIGTPDDEGGNWYDFSNIGDTYADFENPLLSHNGYGQTGIDETFTASEDGYYLVLNYETVGEAGGTHRSGATTATTGAFVWKDTQSYDYNGVPNQRDTTFDFALVELEAGQTITLSNSHSNNWAAQIHLVVAVSAEIAVSSLMAKTIYGGGTGWNTATLTASAVPVIFALAIDNCPAGQQPSAAFTVTGAEDRSHYTYTADRSSIYIGEYIITGGNSIVMSASVTDSYATKTFAAWGVR